MLAVVLRFLVIRLVKVFFLLRTSGIERVPKTGGGLVVCNHVSLLDPFMITAAFPRPVRFVMSRKIYDFWLWRGLMRQLKMVPIDVGEGKDRLEFFNKTCQSMINDGELICIFPEGQITRIGHLLAFRKGIEHISKGIKGGIIPVQMEAGLGMPLSFKSGSQESFRFSFSIPRKRVILSIGTTLPNNSSSYFVRQRVQELQAQNFGRRFRQIHSIPYFLKKAKKQYRGRLFISEGEKVLFNNLSINYYPQEDEPQSLDGYNLNWVKFQIGALSSGRMLDFIESDNSARVVSVPDEKSPSVDSVAYHFRKSSGNFEVTHRHILAVVKALRSVYQLREMEVVMGVFNPGSMYGILFNLWFPLFMGYRISLPKSQNFFQLSQQIVSDQVSVLMAPAQVVNGMYKSSVPEMWSSVTDVIIGMERLDDKTDAGLRHLNIRVVQSTGTANGRNIFAVNSPDFVGNDVTGRKMYQEGARDGSVGRPLPGIATKLVDNSGNEIQLAATKGKLFIKGSAVVQNDNPGDSKWCDTGYKAEIDEDGFIYIKD